MTKITDLTAGSTIDDADKLIYVDDSEGNLSLKEKIITFSDFKTSLSGFDLFKVYGSTFLYLIDNGSLATAEKGNPSSSYQNVSDVVADYSSGDTVIVQGSVTMDQELFMQSATMNIILSDKNVVLDVASTSIGYFTDTDGGSTTIYVDGPGAFTHTGGGSERCINMDTNGSFLSVVCASFESYAGGLIDGGYYFKIDEVTLSSVHGFIDGNTSLAGVSCKIEDTLITCSNALGTGVIAIGGKSNYHYKGLVINDTNGASASGAFHIVDDEAVIILEDVRVTMNHADAYSIKYNNTEDIDIEIRGECVFNRSIAYVSTGRINFVGSGTLVIDGVVVYRPSSVNEIVSVLQVDPSIDITGTVDVSAKINAILAVYKHVFFPAGDYLLAGTLTPLAGSKIVGSPDADILMDANFEDATHSSFYLNKFRSHAFLYDSVSNFEIHWPGTFYGNQDNQGSETQTGNTYQIYTVGIGVKNCGYMSISGPTGDEIFNVVQLYTGTHFKISDIRFINGATAENERNCCVDISFSTYGSIFNCYSNGGEEAVDLNSDCTNVFIDKISGVDMTQNVVEVSNAHVVTVSNVMAQNCNAISLFNYGIKAAAYDAGTTYSDGDLVTYLDVEYENISGGDLTAVTPDSDPADWQNNGSNIYDATLENTSVIVSDCSVTYDSGYTATAQTYPFEFQKCKGLTVKNIVVSEVGSTGNISAGVIFGHADNDAVTNCIAEFNMNCGTTGFAGYGAYIGNNVDIKLVKPTIFYNCSANSEKHIFITGSAGRVYVDSPDCQSTGSLGVGLHVDSSFRVVDVFGSYNFSGFTTANRYLPAAKTLLKPYYNIAFATRPTAPQDGQILIDSTSDRMYIYNKGETQYEALDDVRELIVVASATATEKTAFFASEKIRLKELKAVIVGSSTPAATFTVRYAANRNDAGTEVVTSGTAVSSETTGSSVTSFTQDYIPADNWVWIETSSYSGTVTELFVEIIGKEQFT